MPELNWKWPSTRSNGWLPWYVILKNLLAGPFILAGAAFAVLSALCKGASALIIFGPEDATEVIKESLDHEFNY